MDIRSREDYTPDDFGRYLVRRERRKRLAKLVATLGAAGVVAYLGSRFIKGRGTLAGNVKPIPYEYPSETVKGGVGRRVLSGLAIPAGLGLAVAGGGFAFPAIRRPLMGVYGEAIAQAARKNGITRIYDKALRNPILSGLENLLHIKSPKARELLLRRLGISFGEKGAGKNSVKLYDFILGDPKAAARGAVGATSSRRAARLWDNKKFQRSVLEAAGVDSAMPRGLPKKVQDLLAKDIDALSTYEYLPEADRKWMRRNPIYRGIVDRIDDSGLNLDDSVINELLQRRTGKKWFFKDKGNTAGRIDGRDYFSVDELIDEEADIPDPLGHIRKVLNDTEIVEYRPSRKFSPLRKKFLKSRVGKFITEKLPTHKEYGGVEFPMHTEYRIHAVNGKVVPFATSEKWDPIRHFSRFTTNEKRDLERQIQEHLDRIVEFQRRNPKHKLFRGFSPDDIDIRKQVLGFDVGVGPDGKAIIYEMNPTMPLDMHAGSGQLLHPDVQNAVDAAIKGKMPFVQKLQLALGGSGIAGGTGIAASGVRGAFYKNDN